MKTTRTRMERSTRGDRVFCAIALAAALTALPPCVDDARSHVDSNRSVTAAGTELVVPLHDAPDLRSTDRADGTLNAHSG